MHIIFLSVVAWSSCAKLDRTYLPPHAQSSAGSDFLQTPNQAVNSFGPTDDFSSNAQDGFNQNGFNQISFNRFNVPQERPQAPFERTAAILRQDNQNDGEYYSYGYETENGISAEESGVATNGVEAQGGYSYTGDDGQVYTVRYTAGQNGFMPVGDHLPTPPPIPEEILKALEQNARDEAAGIYDDGSYNENKYGDNQYNFNGIDNGINFNRNYDGNDEDSVVINSAFRSSNQGPSFDGVKTYLPPVETQRPSIQGNVASNQGFRRVDGVKTYPVGTQRSIQGNRAVYLPPVQSRSQSNGPINRSNGFGPRRYRPSFNSRDGYNY